MPTVLTSQYTQTHVKENGRRKLKDTKSNTRIVFRIYRHLTSMYEYKAGENYVSKRNVSQIFSRLWA
jgi:hypothetical protein